jgi:hypothetical protein
MNLCSTAHDPVGKRALVSLTVGDDTLTTADDTRLAMKSCADCQVARIPLGACIRIQSGIQSYKSPGCCGNPMVVVRGRRTRLDDEQP